MRDYIIVTDSDSELDLRYVQKYNLPVFAMPFTMDGVEYLYDLGVNVKMPDFFRRLGEGAEVSTSARPYWEIKEFFKQYTDQGLDVLYIAFSNKLSAHYENSLMAAKELMEEDPSANIVIIDTLTISLGQSQLLIRALEMKEEGKSMDEVAAWVRDNIQHSVVFFVVDDLNYLKRGGRLSGASAFFGSMLDIKPIIYASPEGALVPIEKCKGRRKALRRFVELYEERALDKENGKLYITESNEGDAAVLRDMFLEKFPNMEIEIWTVGPVIGGHVGPGVLGLSFFGTKR